MFGGEQNKAGDYGVFWEGEVRGHYFVISLTCMNSHFLGLMCKEGAVIGANTKLLIKYFHSVTLYLHSEKLIGKQGPCLISWDESSRDAAFVLFEVLISLHGTFVCLLPMKEALNQFVRWTLTYKSF